MKNITLERIANVANNVSVCKLYNTKDVSEWPFPALKVLALDDLR